MAPLPPPRGTREEWQLYVSANALGRPHSFLCVFSKRPNLNSDMHANHSSALSPFFLSYTPSALHQHPDEKENDIHMLSTRKLRTTFKYAMKSCVKPALKHLTPYCDVG